MMKNYSIIKNSYFCFKKGQYGCALAFYGLFKIKFPELSSFLHANENIVLKAAEKKYRNLYRKQKCQQLIMKIPTFGNHEYTAFCLNKVILNCRSDFFIDICVYDFRNSFIFVYVVDYFSTEENTLRYKNILMEKFFKENHFFDKEFYEKQYGPIVDSESALEHFISIGFKNGYFPSGWFELQWSVVRQFIKSNKKEISILNTLSRCTPKVSILIPVFNNACYLNECIESVRNQTLKDIEIIIINDGSTDMDAVKILIDFSNQDSRIKLINKRNSGYGHSMNIGIRAATGEYIGIVESDDYVLPKMYEKMYYIAQKKSVDFVKCNFKKFSGDRNERIFEDLITVTDKNQYNKILNAHENIYLMKMYNTNTNGIFKRKFLCKNNICFNETPGASFQDNGFWFQTYALSTKFYCIPDAFYMIRRDNPNSSVMSKGKVLAMSLEYQYIRDFLKKHPEIESKFLKAFYLKKFNAYSFTFNRIDQSEKKHFLYNFVKEFEIAYNNGVLDSEFFGKVRWNTLMRMINDIEGYYRVKMGIFPNDTKNSR